jgi:hypothetical protein
MGVTGSGGTNASASLFAITAKPPTLSLTQGGAGAVAFTVSFGAAPPAGTVPFPAHANLVPQDPTIAPWLILDGLAARAFAPNSTEVYTVKVTPPADARPDNYAFRLDMVGDENPDEQYTQGPTVSLAVAVATRPKRALPSWLWIVIAAVGLLAIVAIVLTVTLHGRKAKVEVPDVSGLTQHDGQLILERLCNVAPACVSVIPQMQTSPAVASGLVIATDPPAGKQVEEGGTVTLIVSSGSSPPLTRVPPRTVIPFPTREVLQDTSGRAAIILTQVTAKKASK